jgi:bacteriophage CI repressor helix-turn-helix domain
MRLKKLREQKKLNQTELANLLEVSNGSISKWERGDRQPDYETLEKIADTFNVTIDYLLGRSDIKYKSDNSQINFSTPQEALSFILKQEMVADFGGYDLENMSDDEIMEMAEDIADMLKIISRKHK